METKHTPGPIDRNIGKPRKGDAVYYKNKHVGHVLSVEDSLCWVSYPESMGGTNPFIWRFLERGEHVLNNLHDWDSKPKGGAE